jgi:hypothetical protein
MKNRKKLEPEPEPVTTCPVCRRPVVMCLWCGRKPAVRLPELGGTAFAAVAFCDWRCATAWALVEVGRRREWQDAHYMDGVTPPDPPDRSG